MRRKQYGGMELAVIDEDDADTAFIYSEVFLSQVYYHPEMRLRKYPVVMDVGSNIGIYSIWAHRRYQPFQIFAYEASPRTFQYLADNVDRLVDPETTRVTAVNRAVTKSSGHTLTLHQSTRVSGISTVLDRESVEWVKLAAEADGLETHSVETTTISDEMATHGIEQVDILKIDVEGHFLEVLAGIRDEDFSRIKNIVLEVDYLPETGIDAFAVEEFLRSKGFETDCLDRTQPNNLTFYAWRPVRSGVTA